VPFANGSRHHQEELADTLIILSGHPWFALQKMPPVMDYAMCSTLAGLFHFFAAPPQEGAQG
jgi:hypothetical protein